MPAGMDAEAVAGALRAELGRLAAEGLASAPSGPRAAATARLPGPAPRDAGQLGAAVASAAWRACQP